MTYLSGIKEFIQSWDDCFVIALWKSPTPIYLPPVPRASSQGKFPGQVPRAILTVTEPLLATTRQFLPTSFYQISSLLYRYFKKYLELGVRELAIALIRKFSKFNCITYSSCQGHCSTPDAVWRPRYVAILPRNPQEYERFFNLFHHLAKLTNQQIAHNSVPVAIGGDTLEFENCVMPGITL